MFKNLPYAAIIGGSIFCVHGGLSPELLDLSEIEKVVRPHDIGNTGIFSDLTWSDPVETPEWFAENRRKIGFYFGPKATEAFLQKYNFQILVRAHEVCAAGYQVNHNEKCLTIFSSSSQNNKASAMSIDSDLRYTLSFFDYPSEEELESFSTTSYYSIYYFHGNSQGSE